MPPFIESSNSEIVLMELETRYFYLAGHCRMNCTHCWLKSPDDTDDPEQKETFLSSSTFQHVLEQGLDMGVKNVKLTGGEPSKPFLKQLSSSA